MARLEGFADGDTIWLARVHIEGRLGSVAVEARPNVEEATVFLAEHSLVRVGDRSPREPWFSEVVFRTRAEAWGYCATRLAAGAAELTAKAAECLAQAGVAQPAEVA